MKELTQFLKENYKILPLFLGVIILPFNRVIFSEYPNFFFGKFNYFQTQTILLSALILLAACIIYLSLNLKRLKLSSNSLPTNLSLIFLAYLFLISSNLHYLIGFILVITLQTLTKKERNKIILALAITAGIQITISIFQLFLQSDLGLQIIGEPKINHDIKGIAKIRTSFATILRPYGTLPHPNILGALVAITLLLTTKTKNKLALTSGLLSSLSVSANLSTFITQLFSKKNKILIIVLTGTLITTVSIRLLDTDKGSITERIEQTENVSTNKYSIKELLIGTNQNISTENKAKPWHYTPTHNTYLQTFQLAGILGLIILLATLAATAKTNIEITIFLSTMFLLDHFWITTPHGILLLSLLFGLKSKQQLTKILY